LNHSNLISKRCDEMAKRTRLVSSSIHAVVEAHGEVLGAHGGSELADKIAVRASSLGAREVNLN
jgi:hypothetical protein